VTPATAPRVLQVVLSLDTGGTERLVIQICTKLQHRFGMAVCCLDSPGALARELTGRGIEVAALHRDTGFRPSLGQRIAEAAQRHRATIIHCHQYSPFVYGLIARLYRPALKLVFTEHGRHSDAPPSLKRRLVNPLLGRLPGSLHSVSGALRDSMVAEGFPSRRIDVIHNGVDPGPRPTPVDRRNARHLLQVADDAFVIGTVARLDPVKDLDALIEAFVQVRSHDPRSVLVIVGDGPQRRRLERAADDLGVASAVRFLGDRRDVRRLLPGFDLFANSSISEGVSLTILEAMAAELPLVATAVGGTPEVVRHGVTGVLVPARQPGALADAMIALSASPERRHALGVVARLSVEERFAIDGMVERYASVYERLAG
jgi:glycosyltransferase involved in cell wall biosynthesis